MRVDWIRRSTKLLFIPKGLNFHLNLSFWISLNQWFFFIQKLIKLINIELRTKTSFSLPYFVIINIRCIAIIVCIRLWLLTKYRMWMSIRIVNILTNSDTKTIIIRRQVFIYQIVAWLQIVCSKWCPWNRWSYLLCIFIHYILVTIMIVSISFIQRFLSKLLLNSIHCLLCWIIPITKSISIRRIIRRNIRWSICISRCNWIIYQISFM
jgi:hypothetical protein